MRGAVDLAYLFFLLFPTTLMSTPPPRLVVVDDTDGSIEYTGPWLLDNKSKDAAGNFGPPYLHTLHSTKDSAALTFSFNGKLQRYYRSPLLDDTVCRLISLRYWID